ncbi:MAG: DivIVA domain-containing protein, partial [Acidimicrobiia bacterium]
MVEFTPDVIAQRSFRTTLRGFDQHEVRQFLADLARQVEELVGERDRLAATMQAADTIELKDEIETVSREIHSVLEAARSAAETMRERAAAEAARWRSEAIAEAEQTRREAQADSEHLRTDAWATSENLLTQAQREAARIRDEAEKESMRLVGEAEREAHRTLGNSRREAEETLRSARMEAEKLVLDARASHDEIIESANRKAEIAQERTRALEARRDELRKELDSVRAAIAAVESELDERREALGLTPTPEPAPSGDPGEHWVPGETVRVVRPGHPDKRSDEPAVVSEPRPRPEPTPELRVLTPEELRSRQAEPPTGAPEPDKPADPFDEYFSAGIEVEEVVEEAESKEPAQVEPVDELDESETAAEPGITAEPEDDPVEGPVVETRPTLDAVEGLFARLRQPVETEPETRRQASDTADEEVGARPVPVPAGAPAVDPFEARDEILLPIANRALRNLKRQLTEQQNEALESIRIDHEAWEPDSDAIASAVRPDLVVLAAESFGAGHRAAELLAEQQLPRPSAPADANDGGFAEGLAADVTKVLGDARAHTHGARQVASEISRVFRAWRTDEAERRVRHLSFVAFNQGLVASLGDRPLRWVVAGRGCASCRDHASRPVEAL